MITPATLVLTFFLSVYIFKVRRENVVAIYIVGMCFVPADQAIVIAGLDFKVLRIFALAGLVRIFLKQERQVIVFNRMDWLFFLWILLGTIAYLFLWGTMGAFIYKLGVMVDTYILYYVFRNYVRDASDIQRAMHTLVVCMIGLTPFIFIEQFTGQNPFAILGRELTSFREGRIRCSGAFSHAILLGSFAASIVPLSIALLKITPKHAKNRKLYIIGVACSIYVTIASASSGPLIALMAGVFSVLAFRFRAYTGKITYGMIAMAIFLHIVMEAPVWHLVSRIDLSGGSTGYHRFYLIDQTIKNFGEWALVGVKGVAHWGVWAGDVTSMYIAQGVDGGFISMVLFVWLVVLCIRVPWKASLLKVSKAQKWVFWGCCCSFLTHAISFLSVAYFGQINMMLTLGLVFGAILLQRWNTFRAESST